MTDVTNIRSNNFDRLVKIMAQLRDPDTGCPWDVEQDFESIAPYTLEESYEVVDAIRRKDMQALRDELGDLLLQVVFHSQMASEIGVFDVNDVADAICEKMIRRHPHVFANETYANADEQTEAWEKIKEKERNKEKTKKNTNLEQDSSTLDGIAIALPSLTRAEKLAKRAARVGFDWPNSDLVFDKIEEELNEVRLAIETNDEKKIEEEVGDVLFAVANLARKLSVDPETSLRKANEKFERRFRSMEKRTQNQGVKFDFLDLESQENLWQQVKSYEK